MKPYEVPVMVASRSVWAIVLGSDPGGKQDEPMEGALTKSLDIPEGLDD